MPVNIAKETTFLFKKIFFLKNITANTITQAKSIVYFTALGKPKKSIKKPKKNGSKKIYMDSHLNADLFLTYNLVSMIPLKSIVCHNITSLIYILKRLCMFCF